MPKAFRGKKLEETIEQLPGGWPKMEALESAIAQADAAAQAGAADAHFWRMMFRYSYCCEATFRDDPPKAIPFAMELANIYEEHPEELQKRSPEGAVEMYLMSIQIAIDPIVSLPQIPKQQWEALMQKFYEAIRQHHIGLRTYWSQMCNFWQYIDAQTAFSYFQKFWKTGRDSLSDCRACERSQAVRMCLLVDDREAADQYAKPMEAGRIRFCSQTPQRYWLAYLEHALRHGDRQRAELYANKLYRKAHRDKSDLDYLGAILHCWAYTDLERAVEVCAKRLHWTLDMWDQKKVFEFDKGAFVCFARLAQQQETVSLSLPARFPLYREDGIYPTAALADWFYQQAAQIGAQFDQRNESDFFTQSLQRAKEIPL